VTVEAVKQVALFRASWPDRPEIGMSGPRPYSRSPRSRHTPRIRSYWSLGLGPCPRTGC